MAISNPKKKQFVYVNLAWLRHPKFYPGDGLSHLQAKKRIVDNGSECSPACFVLSISAMNSELVKELFRGE